MTTLSIKDTTSYIAYAIEEILGPNGIDVLGEYTLRSGNTVIGTTPAIQVDYPRDEDSPAYDFVVNSGIEATILSEPDIIQAKHKHSATSSTRIYQIELNQYEPKGNVSEAVERLMSSSLLDILENVIVSPSRRSSGSSSGWLPPKAVLFHRQKSYLPQRFTP